MSRGRITTATWTLGAIMATSFGLAACTDDALDDGGDPAGATEAAVADDAVAALTAVHDGERVFLPRTDGGRIPMLTLEEIAQAQADAVGASAPTAAEGLLFGPPPASHDLSAFQTPVKDQLDRGSCGTFATVGAIEAAYRRSYGLTLDLSEQYMFHVAKSTGVNYPKIYQYENQSSYWFGGGWPTTTYLLPTEVDAPYAGTNLCPAGVTCRTLASIPGASALVWEAEPSDNHVTQQQVDAFEYSPLHIPPAARNNARYGVATWTDYGATDARNTALLESLIAADREVVIAVGLNWRTRADGVLDYDATVDQGAHVFLLIGYDRAQDYFLVKNSWGGSAPSAYLKVSYAFLRNAAYGAATVNSVVNPYGAPQAKARWLGVWHQDHEGWKGQLVVRRLTPPTNSAVRLGTYYAGGSYAAGHSVNGVSIDSNRGLRFYVAAETENAPGTLTGQRFEVDQYDNQPTSAAGTVWWDATGEGGVYLGRTPLAMPYSNAFATSEWLGTWDLTHNGNRGTLTITSVTGTTGDYVVNATLLMGGSYRTVTGTVERARPTIAHLLVGGADTYTLHYHFWEDRLASGAVTRTGVARAGVHAVRR